MSDAIRLLKAHFKARWVWIALLYLSLAMGNVRTKVFITAEDLGAFLTNLHGQLIEGTYGVPPQYRLLQFWPPEMMHRWLNVSLGDAYMLQRLAWTFLAFVALHLYLRRWFDWVQAMAATLFFAATMQWTYFSHTQEAEPLNIFLFIVGLWAIREDRLWPLLVILAIGSMNKLTIVFLPFTYLLCWAGRQSHGRVLLRTGLQTVIVVGICGYIRWVFRDADYITETFQWPHNIDGLIESAIRLPVGYYFAFHFGIFFLYGALWLMAAASFSSQPVFLRRASLMIPLFIVGHMIIARIDETRLFLPLAPIIIPMGMGCLFRPGGNRGRGVPPVPRHSTGT